MKSSRPTRDGIHGREYISTVVDLGRHLRRLEFDSQGKLLSEPPASMRLPLPIVFDVFPFGDLSERVWSAVADAATRIGTIVFMPYEDAVRFEGAASCIVPLIPPEKAQSIDLSGYPMVELPHGGETSDAVEIPENKISGLVGVNKNDSQILTGKYQVDYRIPQA